MRVAAVIVLSLISGNVRAGDPAPREAALCPGRDCYRETRTWLHSLSARYDVGSASAYGLGYMFGRAVVGSGYPDAYSLGHLSLAVDARAVTRNHGQVDATTFSLAARAGATASFGGFGIELLSGLGEPRQGSAQGLMSVGVFWSFFFLELGYGYQFPLTGSRPDWMSSHQFSVRINVPVYRQGSVTRDFPSR